MKYHPVFKNYLKEMCPLMWKGFYNTYYFVHVCVHIYTYIQKKIDRENTRVKSGYLWVGEKNVWFLLLPLPHPLPLLFLICIFHNDPTLLF